MEDADIKKYIGHTSQLFGINDYTANQGKARGMRVLDVKNSSGLTFSVLPDRGLDISNLSFKGVNYSYISSVGLSSPMLFDGKGSGFKKNFTAGFLTTCGLLNVGASSIDQGEELGIHGRISNIPAEEVCSSTSWIDNKAVMCISGKLRESRFFGENILLKREILCNHIDNRIIINDQITNEGFRRSPLMLLYHFNLGYPLLDENAKLIFSETKVTPRDEIAEKGLSEYSDVQPPTPSYAEQVFYHDLKPDENGLVFAGLVNDKIGHGVKITFDKNELSMFTQWKQMGESEYVVGIEPCNCPVEGRASAREKGLLEFIEPGEIRKVKIVVDIL